MPDPVIGVLAHAASASHHSIPTVAIVGGVVAALAILVKLASRQRGIEWRDPQRAFSPAQRRAIFDRCDGRCEHHSLILGRCRAAATQADHIYPWSLGGDTSLANGAGLCARHNRMKSNHIPSGWYIRRLENARKSYFPPGEPVEVARSFH